ncbi:MAG TPA: ComEC family competence protein [Rhizobiales bacterium]|nr:ComEC family competence protein [Hyphomicrobiales bacterium]
MVAPTELGTAGGRLSLSAASDGGQPVPHGPAALRPIPFLAPSAPTFWHAGAAALAVALETERDRGTAFVLIPVMLACGALVYFSLSREPSFPLLAAAGVFVAAAVMIAHERPLLRPTLIAALVALAGMSFAKWETDRAGTLMLGEAITTVVTGKVIALERQASGRFRLTLTVLATERPALRHVPERVRVSAREMPAGLAVGDVVTGPARLIPPSGPLRPGGYDFSFESFFDGIGANGFFLGNPRIAEKAPPATIGDRFKANVENARLALSARIRARIGGAEGEIAAALIAGVRAGIPDDVNEDLRRAGLAHVLSISGLHMALVAATVMGALRGGFSLFPGFASRRPVKKYAAGAALCAIGVYLFISGSAVAAERSFLMLAVMLGALLFDRAALTIRNLAIAAIAVLVVSPHEVVGPSFQMSFAATAALIGGYAWWAERRRRRRPPSTDHRSHLARAGRTLLRYAAWIAVTSLIAGAATSLYGVWHFQRVSPLSLAANLTAMPIVSIAVMPPAVLAVAAMPLGFDGPFLDIMGRGIAALVAIARWFSERTPVDAVGTLPASAVAVASVALLIATLATTWLRFLALPFAAAAAILVSTHSLPEALIAEDGRLLGVPLGDGRLAVSRSRPDRFAVEIWTRATRSAATVAPTMVSGRDINAPPRARSDMPGDGFTCTDGLCLARSRAGIDIARVDDAGRAAGLCGRVQVIVLADAAAANPCVAGETSVITQRDLALRGSAAIAVTGDGATLQIDIVHAVPFPLRPWHDHRQYSRAARGLPPRESSDRAGPSAVNGTGPPAAGSDGDPPNESPNSRRVSIGGSVPPADPEP